MTPSPNGRRLRPLGGAQPTAPSRAWILLLAPLLVAACGDGDEIAAGTFDLPACEPDPTLSFVPLPERDPPPGVTSGAVPHFQLDAIPNEVVIAELHERVFAIAEVEARESLLVGNATAIWIRPEINVGRPQCIVAGREVAHIHQDGSIHGVLPLGRIDEAESAGWGERHPWSGLQPGFEGFVLLFTPRSSDEVDVILDLVREGLEFVRGP